MCLKQGVGRTRGEALDPGHGCADPLAVRHKVWSGFVDRRRQQLKTEPVAFQDIDKRMVNP